MQGALAEHRVKLATALEVHGFNRDCDDLNERINEKVAFTSALCLLIHKHTRVHLANNSLQATAVSSDDYGKDLAGVQALQRRQDDVERDMTALHSQLGVSIRNRNIYLQCNRITCTCTHFQCPIAEAAGSVWDAVSEVPDCGR